MAITAPIIGTPVATFINGLATLEGIVVPAGVAVGDLLELHVSVVHTVGTPVDFTCDGFAIVGSNFRSIDDTAQVTIMHKVAVASDIGATYTMTATNAADVTGRTQAVIRVVPGAALPTNGDAVPGVNVTSTVTHAATVNFTEAGGWFAMTVGTRNGYTFSSATLTERVDFNDAGTNASLGVFDSNGAVATGNVSHTVTVSNSSSAGVRVAYALYEGVPANAAPNAVFTWSTTGLQGEFDATNSTDSDGTITEYAWDYGDGNTRTLAWHTNTHDYAAPGEYLVTLTVTDDGGATDTTSQTVTITAPSNTAPTVTLTPATIDYAEPGQEYTVTATASDVDGTVVSTTFSAPGLTLTGSGLTRTFEIPLSADPETYTITATVTDDDGATGTDTTTVNAAPCDTFIFDGVNLVPYVRYIITEDPEEPPAEPTGDRVQPLTVESFGPNGTHWESDAPWFHDDTANTVTVAADWDAIKTAVNGFTEAQRTAGARVLIQDGVLSANADGSGGGGGDTPRMEGAGATTWTRNVLVRPVSIGGVTLAGDCTIRGNHHLTIAGIIDPDHKLTVVRSSHTWLAWSVLYGSINQGQGGYHTEGGGWCEVYTAELDTPIPDGDPMGIASGYNGDGIYSTTNGSRVRAAMVGCYIPSRWRELGSSGHIDSFQMYGAGVYDDFTVTDSALWGCDNAALQIGGKHANADFTQTFLTLEHSLFVTGSVAEAVRYPKPAGSAGASTTWAVNGGGDMVNGYMDATDSVIAGGIYVSQWRTVQNTRIPATDSDATVTDGAWTIDPTITTAGYLDSICPQPTVPGLVTMWENAGL